MKKFRSLTVLAAAIAALVVMATPASAASIQTFKSRWSGKCIDLTDGSTSNGKYIQQWSCSGGPHQKWTDAENSNNGVIVFKNPTTGKCIDGFKGHGSDAVIWTCDGTSHLSQQWV
jgi:hypothetical protein